MAPKRLLLLSYYFPPTPSVGGVRAAGLARYLPEFGWQATVVTPRREDRSADEQIWETDDADLAAVIKKRFGLPADAALKDAIPGAASPGSRSRFLSGLVETLKSVVAFPDGNRGWIPIAAAAARELHSRRRFDALLSTSPPPSAQLAGKGVAERTGLPWVADLRDLWSEDRNSLAPAWRRWLDRRLEQRTLGRASALVTVSEPFAGELRRLHPGLPVHAIANGFDPELRGPAEPLSGAFTLTHTGTFYQGRRDPTLLFEVVRALVDEGRIPRQRLRIRLFARHEPWVADLARRHGLEGLVEILPWTSRSEAIRAQQESQVLLLLHWGGEREAGVFTGKVFEYLAARRPILMIGGGEGVLHDLLARTAAGVHVSDREQLRRQLVAWWEEFERSGRVAWHGRDELIDDYSQRRMAREFAAVLDGLS